MRWRRLSGWSSHAACALAMVLGTGAAARADVITFVPPTDASGHVYSTASNDGWWSGRGLVFVADAPVLLDSIALFNDFTNIDLRYRVAVAGRTSGQVRLGQSVLREGSAVVSTAGLDWVTFPVSPTHLRSGHAYHIEYLFNGDANQNFFYRNCAGPSDPQRCDGQVRYSLGPFSNIDGTANGNTDNFVQPAIRVTVRADTAATPEPASMTLLCGALAACVGRRLLKKREAAGGEVALRGGDSRPFCRR